MTPVAETLRPSPSRKVKHSPIYAKLSISPLSQPSPPLAFSPLTAHPLHPHLVKVEEEPKQPPPQTVEMVNLHQAMLGAPEFTIGEDRSRSLTVTYRAADGESPDNGRDHVEFVHQSFELSTLPPEKYFNGLVQSSRTISANGIEHGTVGLEYFLQLPMSTTGDTLKRQDSCHSGRSVHDLEHLGVRPPNIERLLSRLVELGRVWEERQSLKDSPVEIDQQHVVAMHANLFSNLLLLGEDKESAEEDRVGLDEQIAALVQALSATTFWFDMSKISERKRLYERLWVAEEQSHDNATTGEWEILLLQITLAAELLVRMDMFGRMGDVLSSQNTKMNSLELSKKVKWDLVLAQRFLHGVSIEYDTTGNTSAANSLKRNSVVSMLSFVTAQENLEEDTVWPVMFPRHESTQLDGLQAFAMALGWPHADELLRGILSDSQSKEETMTAVEADRSPESAPEPDGHVEELMRSDEVLVVGSVEPFDTAAFSNADFATGLSTRAWLAGLVMPGESASNLLISSLMELTPAASQWARDSDNLDSGFHFWKKSFWSKKCVVGRVLGASQEARDCMGWVSISRDADLNETDGPMRVYSKPVIELPTHRPDSRGATEKRSTNSDGLSLQSNDMTWPMDGTPALGNELEGYKLTFEKTKSDCPEVTEGNMTAVLTFFSQQSGSGQNPLSLPLIHDSYFVSSQPCFPRERAPQTPVINQNSKPRSKRKELPAPLCHPMNGSCAYRVVPATRILTSDTQLRELLPGLSRGKETDDSSFEASADIRRDSGAGGEEHTPLLEETEGSNKEVLVLDCRGPPTLQLLARAWCANVGFHALVGRQGRTCLGCCIREARCADIEVVLRV